MISMCLRIQLMCDPLLVLHLFFEVVFCFMALIDRYSRVLVLCRLLQSAWISLYHTLCNENCGILRNISSCLLAVSKIEEEDQYT